VYIDVLVMKQFVIALVVKQFNARLEQQVEAKDKL